MHSFTTLPAAPGPPGLGTIIVGVIALVFVGLIVVGSRPSVMAKYRDADDDAGAPEGGTPPAGRGRRRAAP